MHRSIDVFPQVLFIPKQIILPADIPEAHFKGWEIKALDQSSPISQ